MKPTASGPKVSLCVPTYNGGKFLRECLASIQAQTLADFEVVIVDDDSTDDSLAIAGEFARADARFQIHRNPRRLGLVGNLNRSLELSRGTWIKILFQDDTLEPDCLQALTDGCERQQCQFGFCSRNFWFAAEVTAEVRDYFTRHQAMIGEKFSGRMDALAFARLCAAAPETNPVGEPTAVIFHRSLLEKFGAFNPLLIQLCDAEYWLRIGGNLGVAHVPERLATFRVHGQSATTENSIKRKYRADHLDPLIIRYLILRDRNFQNIRRMLCAQTGRFTAWWRLVHQAHRAWAIARSQPATGQGRIPEMDEWNDVARQLPGLRSLAWAGRLAVPLQYVASRAGLFRRRNKFHPGGPPAQPHFPPGEKAGATAGQPGGPAAARLAIIVPAYKAKFLRATLQSIAAQTDRHFHLYVGDDGSPEPIAEIVREFAGRLPVTFHRFAENLGKSSLVGHWERCIRLTREPWVWVFADDDLMDASCVAAFFAELEKTLGEHDLYRFDTVWVDEHGARISESAAHPPEESGTDYLLSRLEGNRGSTLQELIFSRAAWEQAGGIPDFPLAWHSDEAFAARLGMRRPLKLIPGPKVSWRFSGLNISGNSTSAMTNRKIIISASYLRWVMKFFADHAPAQLAEAARRSEKWLLNFAYTRWDFLHLRTCGVLDRLAAEIWNRPRGWGFREGLRLNFNLAKHKLLRLLKR